MPCRRFHESEHNRVDHFVDLRQSIQTVLPVESQRFHLAWEASGPVFRFRFVRNGRHANIKISSCRTYTCVYKTDDIRCDAHAMETIASGINGAISHPTLTHHVCERIIEAARAQRFELLFAAGVVRKLNGLRNAPPHTQWPNVQFLIYSTHSCTGERLNSSVYTLSERAYEKLVRCHPRYATRRNAKCMN